MLNWIFGLPVILSRPGAQAVGLGAAATDDDARTRGVDVDAQPVTGALDLDPAHHGAHELRPQVVADLPVLDEQVLVLLVLGEPPRLPVGGDAEAEPVRVDLLAHYFSPFDESPDSSVASSSALVGIVGDVGIVVTAGVGVGCASTAVSSSAVVVVASHSSAAASGVSSTIVVTLVIVIVVVIVIVIVIVRLGGRGARGDATAPAQAAAPLGGRTDTGRSPREPSAGAAPRRSSAPPRS